METVCGIGQKQTENNIAHDWQKSKMKKRYSKLKFFRSKRKVYNVGLFD